MSRGLSQQQRQILGIAYHANRITQREPRLKSGAPVPNYRVPTVDYAGPKDMQWPLAAHLVHGLQFTRPGQCVTKSNGAVCPAGAYFDLTKKSAKSAKASTIRALSTLTDQGYFILAPRDAAARWGYVLTDKGMAEGTECEVEFPEWIYIRAGLIWFPKNTWDKRLFDVIEHCIREQMSIPAVIARKESLERELLEEWKRKGYSVCGQPYTDVSNARSIRAFAECVTDVACCDPDNTYAERRNALSVTAVSGVCYRDNDYEVEVEA